MIGNVVWNIVIGMISGLMSFWLAIVNHNLLLTALTRGVIAFVVMFVLTYLFRWLIALILTDIGILGQSEEEQPEGSTIDLATPEDDIELPSLHKDSPSAVKQADDAEAESSQEAEGKQFQPFVPPRIARKDDSSNEQLQAEQLAEAVRRFTEL